MAFLVSTINNNISIPIYAYPYQFPYTALCIVYEYLLHVHRDGRILDLWRRINAPYDEFFIPDDFEISAEELQVMDRV
ncbi:hypothetical protein EON63_13470 [archaeon]|nr:MAG: hypothetical protein EON63_13470 [archaeon]